MLRSTIRIILVGAALLVARHASANFPSCFGSLARKKLNLTVIEDRITKRMYVVKRDPKATVVTLFGQSEKAMTPELALLTADRDLSYAQSYSKYLEKPGQKGPKDMPKFSFNEGRLSTGTPQMPGLEGRFMEYPFVPGQRVIYQPTGDEEIYAAFDLLAASRKELASQRPSRMTSYLRELQASSSLANAAVRFVPESIKFNVAVGALAYQNALGNPVAREQFIDGLSDPVGHAGFFGFIYANQECSRALRSLIKNPLAQVLFGYTGMACGMLASNIVHEIAYYPGLKELMMNAIHQQREGSRGGKDYLDAMDAAYDAWMELSLQQKAQNEFMPGLTSLVLSTMASGLAEQVLCQGTAYATAKTARALGAIATKPQGTLNQLLGRSAIESLVKRIVGIDLFLSLTGVGAVRKVALTSARWILSDIPKFYLFLKVDEVIHEPLTYVMENGLLTAPRLERSEANIQKLLKEKDKNYWQRAPDVQVTTSVTATDDPNTQQTLYLPRCKTVEDAMKWETCYADIEMEVQRYLQLGAQWRRVITSDLIAVHAGWSEFLARYNETYASAKSLFDELIEHVAPGKMRPRLLTEPLPLYGVMTESHQLYPKLDYRYLIEADTYNEVLQSQKTHLNMIAAGLSRWLKGEEKTLQSTVALVQPLQKAYKSQADYPYERYFPTSEIAGVKKEFADISALVLSSKIEQTLAGVKLLNVIIGSPTTLQKFEELDSKGTFREVPRSRFAWLLLARLIRALPSQEQLRKMAPETPFETYLQLVALSLAGSSIPEKHFTFPAQQIESKKMRNDFLPFARGLAEDLKSSDADVLARGLNKINLALEPCKAQGSCWDSLDQKSPFSTPIVNRKPLPQLRPQYAAIATSLPNVFDQNGLAVLKLIRDLIGNPEPLPEVGQGYLETFRNQFIEKPYQGTRFGTALEDLIFQGPRKPDYIDDALAGFVMGPRPAQNQSLIPKNAEGFSATFLAPSFLPIKDYRVQQKVYSQPLMTRSGYYPLTSFLSEPFHRVGVSSFDVNVLENGKPSNFIETILRTELPEWLFHKNYYDVDIPDGRNRFWGGYVEDQNFTAMMEFERQYMEVIAEYSIAITKGRPGLKSDWTFDMPKILQRAGLGGEIDINKVVSNRPPLIELYQEQVATMLNVIRAVAQSKRAGILRRMELMKGPNALRLGEQERNFDARDWRNTVPRIRQSDENTRLRQGPFLEDIEKLLVSVQQSYDQLYEVLKSISILDVPTSEVWLDPTSKQIMRRRVTMTRVDNEQILNLQQQMRQQLETLSALVQIWAAQSYNEPTPGQPQDFALTALEQETISSAISGISGIFREAQELALAINTVSYQAHYGAGAGPVYPSFCREAFVKNSPGKGFGLGRAKKNCGI